MVLPAPSCDYPVARQRTANSFGSCRLAICLRCDCSVAQRRDTARLGVGRVRYFACGVTLQLHGGGVAGDVRVLVVGICLRCNCSVAWWADIGVRKPSGLCISPRCDRSVTRQADTSDPGLTAVCSSPVVLRRDIRQPPVHQAPPEIPALLPQRVGRGVR